MSSLIMPIARRQTHVISEATEKKAWQVGAIAVIAGMLNGFDLGALGAAIVMVEDSWDISGWQIGLILGAFSFGQAFGAVCGGLASDYSASRSPLHAISRRALLVFAYLLFFAASVLCYFSINWVMLFWSRIVLGFASGISFGGIPIYVGEIAPASIRGSIASMMEIAVNMGITLSMFICFVVSYSTNEDNTSSYLTWRLLISMSGLPCPILAYLTMVYCPLSPRFLLNTGRVADARNVLTDALHYDGDTADVLIEEMLAAKRVEDSMQMNTVAFWKTLLSSIFCCNFGKSQTDENGGSVEIESEKLLQESSDYRLQYASKTLAIGLTFASLQQLTGVDNLLMYFSTVLSDFCDVPKSEALLWLAVVALIKTATILFVIWKADALGRRRLMIWSSTVMATALAAMLLLLFFATEFTSKSHTTGFGALRQRIWLVYAWAIFVLCYMVGFSLGWGPLMWALLSEIFPISLKNTAVPLCLCASRGVTALQMFLFPPARNYLSIFSVYSFFLLVTVYSLYFVIVHVPETAQRSIESIFMSLYEETKTQKPVD